MTVEYRISVDNRVVFTTLSGQVSILELAAHQSRLAHDPRFNPDGCELIDGTDCLLDATVSYRTFSDNERSSPWSSAARRAIVASSMVGYGLANVFVAVNSKNHGNIRVFMNMQQATEWLELGDETTSAGQEVAEPQVMQ